MRNKGFTIVELLIVVAILSVLAAIAVPQYQHFVTRAKHSEALILITTVHKHQLGYFSTQEQYYPPDAPVGGNNNMLPATANQFFGLPTSQTKLGWWFFNYHGHGPSAGTENKTVGYHVKIYNEIDGTDPFVDAYEVKMGYPAEPDSPICPDGVTIHLNDDISNFTIVCPS